jgi:hypothetical protein
MCGQIGRQKPVVAAIRMGVRIGSFVLLSALCISGAAAKDAPADADAVLRRLNQEAGGHWTKSQEASNPGSLHSDGKSRPLFDPKSATLDVVTQAALDFLTAYADLWQLKDPAKELKRRSAQPDWQVEFRQWNGGVRVFDAGIDVFFTRDGVPDWIRSHYIPGLETFNKSAKLSGAQAIEAARKHLATSAHVSLEAVRVSEKPMLGISASQRDEPSRPPRLLYRLRLMTNTLAEDCEIDARTGEVVSENYLRPQTAHPIR